MSEKVVQRSFQENTFEALEEGKIVGRAAVYNQKTNIANMFYEIIERGAFDECDLSDVRLHINHDISKIPLARSKGTSSTMKIEIDNDGLKMDANLDIENNNDSKAVYNSIKRGDLDGMSFGFYIKEQEWINRNAPMPTRIIKKIKKVTEVSVVNKAAYGGTSVNARSEEEAKKEIDEIRSADINTQLELEKLKIKILYC